MQTALYCLRVSCRLVVRRRSLLIGNRGDDGMIGVEETVGGRAFPSFSVVSVNVLDTAERADISRSSHAKPP